MKKITIFVCLFALMLGIAFVSAEAAVARDGTGPYHDEVIAAGGQNGTGIMAGIKAGNYVGQDGRQIQVQTGESNRMRLRVQDVEARTDLEITSSESNGKTKMNAKLSNGRNAEIKVMPDTASQTALQRLRLRNCNESNNCSIELKEVGQGDQARLAYEVQAERHSRILGIFQAKMQVRAQIDAETGETIRVGKPWWAFLATEPEE